MKKLKKLLFVLPISIAMLLAPSQTLFAKEEVVTKNTDITSILPQPAYSHGPGVRDGSGGSYGIYKEERLLLTLNVAQARPYMYKELSYNGKVYKGYLYIKKTEWAGFVEHALVLVTYAGYLY